MRRYDGGRSEYKVKQCYNTCMHHLYANFLEISAKHRAFSGITIVRAQLGSLMHLRSIQMEQYNPRKRLEWSVLFNNGVSC